MKRLFTLVLLLTALGTGAAAAQQNPAQLLAQARARFDEFQPESAQVLLERVLSPTSGATPQQLVRAWVLFGISQLWRENATGARQAFQQALTREPTLRVDTLEFLHENLLAAFNTAQAAVGAGPAAGGPAAPVERLVVEIGVPADTQLRTTGDLLPITLRPTRRATTVVAIGPADAPLVTVWSDTLAAGASGALGWRLRTSQDALVPSQRYALRATATDSAGDVSETRQVFLVVSRLPVDTQAIPPLPVLEPESLRLRLASPTALLAGVALGAAAAVLPTAFGSPEVNSGLSGDGKAYAVAGAVSLAGIVGFLAGHRDRFLPEAQARNAERRRVHEESVRTVVAANARALENAAIRVQLERGTP